MLDSCSCSRGSCSDYSFNCPVRVCLFLLTEIVSGNCRILWVKHFLTSAFQNIFVFVETMSLCLAATSLPIVVWGGFCW